MVLNRVHHETTVKSLWDRVYTPRKNTICTADGCHSNCHKSCIGENLSISEEIARKCWAFRGSDIRIGTNAVCTECKHAVKYHQNVNDIWEFKSFTILVPNEEARKAFNGAKAERARRKLTKESLKQDLLRMEEDINEYQGRLKALCKQYEDTTISGDFVSRICPALELLRQHFDTIEGVNASSDDLSKLRQIIEESRDPRLKSLTSEDTSSGN
jgi:hypothetical protein